MKLLTGFIFFAAVASVYFTNGFERLDPKSGKTMITQGSVGYHCIKAIPDVWKSAKEAGDDFGGLPETLVFTTFNLVATKYCLCNQEKFGKDRSAKENAFFGQLAGLNLKLEFARGSGRARNEDLQKEGISLAKEFSDLLQSKPAWTKDVNDIFRACRNEQNLRGKLLSSVAR